MFQKPDIHGFQFDFCFPDTVVSPGNLEITEGMTSILGSFLFNVQGKGILKRRVTNEKNKATGDDAVAQQVIVGGGGGESRATAPRRSVTFDETILVKNDWDLAVVQRPLKLELVIEHWKSTDHCAETAPRSTVGVVRRLVDEFNTIEHVSCAEVQETAAIFRPRRVDKTVPLVLEYNEYIYICYRQSIKLSIL